MKRGVVQLLLLVSRKYSQVGDENERCFFFLWLSPFLPRVVWVNPAQFFAKALSNHPSILPKTTSLDRSGCFTDRTPRYRILADVPWIFANDGTTVVLRSNESMDTSQMAFSHNWRL